MKFFNNLIIFIDSIWILIIICILFIVSFSKQSMTGMLIALILGVVTIALYGNSLEEDVLS